MRLAIKIVTWWVVISVPVGLVVGRVLRNLHARDSLPRLEDLGHRLGQCTSPRVCPDVERVRREMWE